MIPNINILINLSFYIIYKLTCICGDECIGETSKEAHIRAKQHLKALIDKKPKLSSFAEHFLFKHSLLGNSQIYDISPFSITVFYKCNFYLNHKIPEAMFINSLNLN